MISLVNGYFIGGIPHFQTYPYGNSQEQKTMDFHGFSMDFPAMKLIWMKGTKPESRFFLADLAIWAIWGYLA